MYGAYHGFLVKQIFQSSFDASPPAHVVLQHMNLPKLNDINEGDEATVDDDDDDDMWIQLPVDRDSVRSIQMVHHFPQKRKHPVLDFLGSAIKEHATKFGHLLGSCIGFEGHHHASLNALSGPSKTSLAAFDVAGPTEFESNDANKDVSAFLFGLRPFLHGLDNLFRELNLNDPTRV